MKVKLIKSPIGTKPVHKKNVEALGFKRLNQIIEIDDNPVNRGKLNKIKHMIEVLDK